MYQAIEAMKTCLKARPNEARMHVMLGNFYMVTGYATKANEHLERALELDEKNCFASHYTIANNCDSMVPDTQTVNSKLNRSQKMQAIRITKMARKHLEKYLELAPHGHWHVHRACLVLCGKIVKLTARGNEKLTSVEAREPGFCQGLHELFERGTAAYKLFVNSRATGMSSWGSARARVYVNDGRILTRLFGALNF